MERLEAFKKNDDGADVRMEIKDGFLILKQDNLLDGVVESIVVDFIRARKLQNFLSNIDLEVEK